VRAKLLHTPGGVTVDIDFAGFPRHSVRQNTEFGIAVVMKALREYSGRSICPTRAAFVHARNSDLRDFQRFFGCPIEFGQAANEGSSCGLLEFSNDTLETPLITADEGLLNALRPFCELAAKERNTAAGTLRSAVEKEVE
jgi:hypothetical protein